MSKDIEITAKIKHEAARQLERLSQGAVQIVPEGGLLQKLEKSLATGTPLRVKLGADPTAPDLHLGHAVIMGKLRQFQELGHHVLLLIGDFTAAIGDPSGRNKTRPPLSAEQIAENAKTYTQQIFKVLDAQKTEVLFNSAWCEKLTMADVVRLLSSVTVSQLLQREDFNNRYSNNLPISMHELLYPIMQGYDSVMMHANVELGGTDQTFNCLMGREMQKAAGQSEQVVITLPLLVGTDGVKKMSKSVGNYVGLTDEPADMFGKIMSIPDELLPDWVALLTNLDMAEMPDHPMEAKKKLAATIVTRFHNSEAAEAARESFEQRFSRREVPEDLPEHRVETKAEGIGLLALMVQIGFTGSNGEGRRLVQGGAVKIDGEAITDPTFQLSPDHPPFVLQAGRRRMARVQLSS